MNELLNYLNTNAGAFTVIFTVAVAIATVVYAILTWKLVSETRLMRQAQTEPKIEITLKSLEIAIHIVRIHIRNIGMGPAVNVKFTPQIVSGGDCAKILMEEFTETNFFKTGIAYFSPNEERVSHYTEMTKDFDGKTASVIAFEVEYEGVTGKKYKDILSIDMSEHKGTYQLGKPHLYSIAQSLEKLQKDVANLVGGSRRVSANVYTTKDREAEHAAIMKRHNQDKQ